MSPRAYKPRRRNFLRALALSAFGVPLLRFGRVLARKRTRAQDLSAIPWIGHC